MDPETLHLSGNVCPARSVIDLLRNNLPGHPEGLPKLKVYLLYGDSTFLNQLTNEFEGIALYQEDQDNMGTWLSYLWWGGDPEASNAVSGLTRREVFAVQNSWAPVYKDSVANGTELLKRLFRAYPTTREFFKMVRKLPEHEYESNMQFKAHVVNLMNSIDLAVRHMNQPDVVAAMMEKIGESHKKRKISEQQFLDLKDVLLKMFIEVLKLDDTTLTAWSKTIDFWYKHIFIHLN